MRTIGLFSIAITMVVVGIAAWAASTHSAVKAELPQIDPLSLEENAKNLPSQEELNLKLGRLACCAPKRTGRFTILGKERINIIRDFEAITAIAGFATRRSFLVIDNRIA